MAFKQSDKITDPERTSTKIIAWSVQSHLAETSRYAIICLSVMAGAVILSATHSSAAEWGHSGNGGDGGASLRYKSKGFEGEKSLNGQGGDGGEGGFTKGSVFKPGKGGAPGSTNPDQKGNIIGAMGTNGPIANCSPNSDTDVGCGRGGPGGGGGGAGLVVTDKGGKSGGDITGGGGGRGGIALEGGGGGGGGGGGAGVLIVKQKFTNNHVLTGGYGGVGGSITNNLVPGFDPTTCTDTTCYSGRGGDGGAGADIRDGATLFNNKTVTGGTGGAGAAFAGPDEKIGNGGNGGNGVDLSNGSTLDNTGQIKGGEGGKAYKDPSAVPRSKPGEDGAAGYGVYAKGNGNTVINRKTGVISAGGKNPQDENAIKFNGDNNTLQIENGSKIIGRVSAIGKNNGLSLGGTEDQKFDASELGTKYRGFDRLQKDDAGTASVSGIAHFEGATIISDGRLNLTGDGDLESSSGIFNNAEFDIATIDAESTKIKTLTGDNEKAVTTLGDKELIITDGSGRYGGTIQGSKDSQFTVAGGHESLTGDNSGYAGTTTVKDGAELTIDKDLGGTTNIEEKGILSGNGSVTSLINTGTFVIGNNDGFATKTIKGDYTGNGGTLVFNTELLGDASRTDRLNINGNSSGNSQVIVNNRNGLGAPTVNGIELISVAGKSGGTFNLLSDYTNKDGKPVVIGGAYEYQLVKGGTNGNPNNFYLTNNTPTPVTPGGKCETDGTCPPGKPNYAATVPLYSVYTQALRRFNGANSLQERVGNRYWSGAGARSIPQGDGPGAPDLAPAPHQNTALTDYGLFWTRVSGQYEKLKPSGATVNSNASINTWSFTAGVDNQLYENEAGRFIGGIWFEYGRMNARVSSTVADGKITANSYGGGGSLTWYGDDAFYVDTLAKVNWYRNDIESDVVARHQLVNGADGFVYALSIETGKRIALDENWSVTPQAQLSWSSIDLKDFTDIFGATTQTGRQSDLTGRLGITANYQNSWQGSDGFANRASFYTGVNLYQVLTENGNNVRISVSGLPDQTSAIIDAGNVGKTWAGVVAGGDYRWHDGKYGVFGNANVASSTKNFGKSYSVAGQVGFSVKW